MRTLDSAHNYASAGAALRQVWQGLTQGSVATYTAEDFMGDVSDGTVTVFEKAGWCLVRGSVVLSSAASNWATVLSSSAVPAPQHGDGLRQVCPYWGTSYTRPTIVSIGSSGGLLLRYGAAGSTAYFHFCYPVD